MTVVSFTGGAVPRRRRRRTSAQNPGASGVGTGFVWYRAGHTIAVYCLDVDRLTVQAVTEMVTSPDEIPVFLQAWMTMSAPDRDDDETTLRVTIDLTAGHATSDLVEAPWPAVRATVMAGTAFEAATVALEAALQRAFAHDNEPNEKGGA